MIKHTIVKRTSFVWSEQIYCGEQIYCSLYNKLQTVLNKCIVHCGILSSGLTYPFGWSSFSTASCLENQFDEQTAALLRTSLNLFY